MTATAERTCGECKAAFQGKRASSKYCSEACRQRHYRNAKRDVTERDAKTPARKADLSGWIGRTIYAVDFGWKLEDIKLNEYAVVAETAERVFFNEHSLFGLKPNEEEARELWMVYALHKSELLSGRPIYDPGGGDTYYLHRETAERDMETARRRAAFHEAQERMNAEEEAKRKAAGQKRAGWYRQQASGPARAYRDFETWQAFEALGLAWPCSQVDIKRAYKTKAKTAHPDAGGKQEDFIQLQQAYELAMNHAKATAGARAG